MAKHILGHTGKIPFPSREEALAYQRRCKGKKMNLYPCLYRISGITHFHFTSQSKSEFKRKHPHIKPSSTAVQQWSDQ